MLKRKRQKTKKQDRILQKKLKPKSGKESRKNKWSLLTSLTGFKNSYFYYKKLGFTTLFLKSPYFNITFKILREEFEKSLKVWDANLNTNRVLGMCTVSPECLELLFNELPIERDWEKGLNLSIEQRYIMTMLIDSNRLKIAKKIINELKLRLVFNKGEV